MLWKTHFRRTHKRFVPQDGAYSGPNALVSENTDKETKLKRKKIIKKIIETKEIKADRESEL